MHESWRGRAACAGRKIDFFAEDESEQLALASWCRLHCTVVAACRAEAIFHETAVGLCFGVFGGMTPAERILVVRDQQLSDDVQVERYIEDYPQLSARRLAARIEADGGPVVSWRTLARRRARRQVA